MKTLTKPLNETLAYNEHEKQQKSKGFFPSPSYSFTSVFELPSEWGGYEMSHSSEQRPETSSGQVNRITLYLTWLTELLNSFVEGREVKRGGTERRLMWKTGEWWEEYKEGVTWTFHLWKRQFIEADHLRSVTRQHFKTNGAWEKLTGLNTVLCADRIWCIDRANVFCSFWEDRA